MDICEEGYAPWIFYSHGERNSEHTFYSLSQQRTHYKCIKEIVDKDIVCSLHGWLILSNQIDRRSWQLFNPVSMATIQLPLLPLPSYDFCALSCHPSDPNCIVMVIKAEEGMGKCYFCRLGDVIWTQKDLVLEWLQNGYSYLPDRIRAIGCYKGHICVFTIFDKILLLAANPPHLTVTDLGEYRLPRHAMAMQYGSLRHYLVESDGELFVIRRFHLRIDAYDFFVGKFDISEKKIMCVENLGGRAFFLSSSSSGIICSAENHGIKENTIYFTRPSDPCIYSFDLQKKVLTFSLPCPNLKTKLVQAEWIFFMSPNARRKLDCNLDTISPHKIEKSMVLSVGKDWSPIAGAEVKLSNFSNSGRGWSELHGYPIFLHMPSSSLEAFHLIHESRYIVSVPENPEILSILHAKDGWLLMSRYRGMELFFLNPLTSEIIKIPDLTAQVRSFCFTSLPTSSTCSVIAICEFDDSPPFVYHICRGSTSWTAVDVPEFETIGRDFELTPYSNPIFHGGIFYWIWGCGNLCTYNPMEKKVKFLVEPESPCKSVCISYLFEIGEKLMSVWAGRHGNWVRVYELNKTFMVWKEVNTLDNKVIFLSRNSSIVLQMQGLEDMICFNRFVNNNQPLVYSLKTAELRVYGSGDHTIRDFCDIPEYQIKSAWIMPNVKQHSVRELSWYNGLHPMLSAIFNWLRS